ncbi:type II secretion system GspH family protein [Parasalinivibrio latis]|uniref:PilW family protein n=1 Tax=Parasalinivibrio latis TaxID=2952610 RepID=UPI0030E3DB12
MHGFLRSAQRGFTLIEMVTVVVIMGIVIFSVGSIIRAGGDIYADTVKTENILGEGRFVLARMTREVRDAVPNSVRVKTGSNWQCLEFLPILSKGRYLSLPIYPAATSIGGTVIMPSGSLSQGEIMWVNPVSVSTVYSVNGSNGVNRAVIDTSTAGSDANTFDITFSGGPLRFSSESPRQRFYVAKTPVSYCYEETKGEVRRYASYALSENQLEPTQMGASALMAQLLVNDVSASSIFTVVSAGTAGNALITMKPEFSISGQNFTFHHQVSIANVP